MQEKKNSKDKRDRSEKKGRWIPRFGRIIVIFRLGFVISHHLRRRIGDEFVAEETTEELLYAEVLKGSDWPDIYSPRGYNGPFNRVETGLV